MAPRTRHATVLAATAAGARRRRLRRRRARAERAAKLSIATTVAPITSIVANIGGDRVQITGIVPEGTNSHTFEPKPSVAELLSTIDVVYVNGLKLEEPTKELAEENLKDGARDRRARHEVDPRERVHLRLLVPEGRRQAQPAPLDRPALAVALRARSSSDDLVKRDPDNAAYYKANYDEFAAQVDAFDTAMRTSFATIPRAKRKLLTYHDAYAYFAATTAGRHRRDPGVGLRGPHAEGGRRAHRPGPGRRRCRRSSARRCSRARCSSRSARRRASSTSTSCATTTCPASPATPSTPGSA